ncbi:hypothetical protein GOP47_0013928 [Adiantum capillus-veneris]|nr:hypothetical protein GOP47_0013928 [Adiantum capillus-veneris]
MPPEGITAKNSSCMPNAVVKMSSRVHPDRLCGIVAPLAPYPPQNVTSFQPKLPGRLHQPAQGPPSHSHGGAMHHQSPATSLDPCKRSLTEAKYRGSKEGCGSCLVTKAGQRTARVCMYFNTPRGCRNGGNCAFLHQSGVPELNALAQ